MTTSAMSSRVSVEARCWCCGARVAAHSRRCGRCGVPGPAVRPAAQDTRSDSLAAQAVDPLVALGSKLSRPVPRHTAMWTIGVATLLFTFLSRLAC